MHVGGAYARTQCNFIITQMKPEKKPRFFETFLQQKSDLKYFGIYLFNPQSLKLSHDRCLTDLQI